MGSQSSNFKKNIHHNWETIDHLQHFNIVRNKLTGELGQLSKFTLDSKQDPKKQLNIYESRKGSNLPIVRVHGAEIVQKPTRKNASKQQSGFCTDFHHFVVINERMPYRLQDLPQLTFPQILLVLRQSMQAYEYLFTKIGPIHITSQMIGLNDQGKVRAWVNADWSKNYPSNEIPTLLIARSGKNKFYNMIEPKFRDQNEVVNNVIDVAEEKCQEGQFPPEFANLLKQNSQSFETANDFLQAYIQGHQIQIPSIIKPNTVFIKPQNASSTVDPLLRNFSFGEQKHQNNELVKSYQYVVNSQQVPLPPHVPTVSTQLRRIEPITHLKSGQNVKITYGRK